MTRHLRNRRTIHASVLAGVAAVALSLTACVGLGTSPNALPTPSPAFPVGEALVTEPCGPEAVATLGLPSADGLLCGAITVPADRATGTSETTELGVMLTDIAAPEGTLLLIGGGPGGASTWMVPLIRALMPEVAASYRIVALDLRGTGPQALDCPAVQEATGSSDILAAPEAAVAACAVTIGSWRDRLSTEAAVEDLEDLRLALGGPRWVLDGTSYGTYVAQRYAMRYPAAVEALILDAPVSGAGIDPFLLSTFEHLPVVLSEACAAMDCQTDPVADLAALIDSGYDPVTLLNFLVATSANSPTFEGVPEALAAARAGDRADLDERIAALHAVPALTQFSAGAHIATLCADTPMPWGGPDTDPAAREAMLAAAIADIAPERTAPFPTSILAELGTIQACLHWPSTAAALPAPGELPDVPALLLSGARDLSTPAADSAGPAAQLPRAEVLTFPGLGHIAQFRPEGIAAISDFLFGLR